jgi:hypothetical protein
VDTARGEPLIVEATLLGAGKTYGEPGPDARLGLLSRSDPSVGS